jgi:crossover junction endodeoxyribonuclease RusA
VPFRQAVAWEALRARAAAGIHEIMAAKHQPVSLTAFFYFQRPASVSKSRAYPSVKPDLDKLCRAVLDALTGILWVDDGQVVRLAARKDYSSSTPGTQVTVQIVED